MHHLVLAVVRRVPNRPIRIALTSHQHTTEVSTAQPFCERWSERRCRYDRTRDGQVRYRPRNVEPIDRPTHLRAHRSCSCSAKRCSYSYSIVRAGDETNKNGRMYPRDPTMRWPWQPSRFDYEHEHRRYATEHDGFHARTAGFSGRARTTFHWKKHGSPAPLQPMVRRLFHGWAWRLEPVDQYSRTSHLKIE